MAVAMRPPGTVDREGLDQLSARGAGAVSAATAVLAGLRAQAPPSGLESPALPAEPAALAASWATLPPAERDVLAAADPALGNRAGLPAVDKDRYNRAYLELLRTAAERDLADAAGGHLDWARGDNVPGPPTSGLPDEAAEDRLREFARWQAEFERRAGPDAAAALRGYAAIAEQLASNDPPRYLLNVDDQGRAAIALGNPDTATRIATFVPGMDSTVDGIGGGLDRARALLDAADAAGAGRGTTSAIAWYDYQAPRGLIAAAKDGAADAGAPRLDQFQDGLRAAHVGPRSYNTVVGHSYGSFVVGTAASGGSSLAADALVLVGSPGLELERVTDLRLDGIDPADNPAHVFATAAAADPVPIVGALSHGPSVTDPDFGATVFGSVGGVSTAHSDYWDPGNPARATMGRIIAGHGG